MVLRHTTPDRATEAFGLFALSGKVTSFIAPTLIAHRHHDQRIGAPRDFAAHSVCFSSG
jgi:MFS-type transporter involved in bile tolerance (Atg22 family)